MNKYTLALLISSSLSYGQVGIKKDNPARDVALDINGTLGISQPGNSGDPVKTTSHDGLPLYWNTDDKKIVAINGNSNNDVKIKHQRYELDVKYKNKEDFIDNVDLGINTNVYKAFILSYRLTKDIGEQIDDFDGTRNVSYIPVSAFQIQPNIISDGNYQNMQSEVNFGYNYWEYGGWVNYGKRGYLGIVTPKVFLKEENNTWHLTADYYGVTPFSFDYHNYSSEYKQVSNRRPDMKFRWIVDILLIPVSMIKDLGEIDSNINYSIGSSRSEWEDTNNAETTLQPLRPQGHTY